MPVTTILYRITANVDWQSNLYIQGSRAQWGIFVAGTVNITLFNITTTVAGQLPAPSIDRAWNPDYTGGLVIPGATHTSDVYDFGVPLPIPTVTQDVTYQFTVVEERDSVTWIQPSGANNYMLTVQYNDPDPGAGQYIVDILATVTSIP